MNSTREAAKMMGTKSQKPKAKSQKPKSNRARGNLL
jgi:hypothetical protein